jgi:hypothetical protein
MPRAMSHIGDGFRFIFKLLRSQKTTRAAGPVGATVTIITALGMARLSLCCMTWFADLAR